MFWISIINVICVDSILSDLNINLFVFRSDRYFSLFLSKQQIRQPTWYTYKHTKENSVESDMNHEYHYKIIEEYWEYEHKILTKRHDKYKAY